MLLKIYTTFDKTANLYSETPFFVPNKDVAVRSTKQNQRNNKFLNDNADDFVLMELGIYDTETGEITAGLKEIHQLTKIEEEKGGTNEQ